MGQFRLENMLRLSLWKVWPNRRVLTFSQLIGQNIEFNHPFLAEELETTFTLCGEWQYFHYRVHFYLNMALSVSRFSLLWDEVIESVQKKKPRKSKLCKLLLGFIAFYHL